jgi:hypothetical protein
MQDAAYVCTGVHVIANEFGVATNGGSSGLVMSIENLWPSRQATQNAALPVNGVDARIFTMQQSISVAMDHFLPASTDSNVGGQVDRFPVNVDYWYAPAAAWLIGRGDTLRCVFPSRPPRTGSLNSQTAGTAVPIVVLSGYKVLG